MFTLIENGDVYAPEPIGRQSVLITDGKIARVGPVDRRGLDLLKVDYEVIDAKGWLVTPGIIDPHEHLRGGSGNGGFSTETPPIYLQEIVTAGITTVVGTLGTDTTTANHAALLARVKGLREEGLSAYMYTGGYNVPPSTITGSVRDDIMLFDEVIGVGEIAISDNRSTDPDARELARVANDAFVGGMLSGKAGVSHFHVGDRPTGLDLVRIIIDDYHTDPGVLYPTHVERTKKLMDEALGLVKRGCTVDIDVVEKDLTKWVPYYLDHGGDPGRLTVSSDAFMTAPRNLYEQLRACARECGVALDTLLGFVTTNTARVLKLTKKGRLEAGMDADVLVLEPGSLNIVEVIAGGKRMVRDGALAVQERFLKECDRTIHLVGQRED